MSAKKRMIEYLELKGISQYSFSKETGLSNGFLKSGNNISTQNLEIIAKKYIDLNLSWLVSGVGDMVNNKLILKNNENVNHYGSVTGGIIQHQVSESSNVNYNASEDNTRYKSRIEILEKEIEALKQKNEDDRKSYEYQIDQLKYIIDQNRKINEQKRLSNNT